MLRHTGDLPAVAARVSGDLSAASREIGWLGVGALLLRAYSMGAGTYTGIEAVSNSMQTLREPRVQTGKRAMAYLAFSLAFMTGGIILGYVLNGVTPVHGKTLNAVLFGGLVDGLWHGSGARLLIAFVLFTEAALLFVAAQTGFLDGPQVLSNMAVDSYMPHRFAHLSEQLVRNYGVYFMGGMAFLMLFITGGSVRYLVIMYSINVFLTFSLSQFGMCRHWWQDRASAGKWKSGLAINGVGFLLTASILCVTIWMKFPEGGWITLLITGSFCAAAFIVRSHYRKAAGHLRRLDDQLLNLPSLTTASAQEPIVRQQAPTAAILVSGYNGLGIHVFFSIIRSFPGTFRNFVFLSVGVIDTSRFKGVAEIENLSENLRGQLANYVEFVKGHGYYGEVHYRVGTDVIEGVQGMATEVAADFPNVVFFAGQLVFQEENFFNKLLHNQTAFILQKKLVFSGHPMIVMPIRVLE